MNRRNTIPNTADELKVLFRELGTWTQVAEHLGLSQWGLRSLKKELGIAGPTRPGAKKRPSCLDPHVEQIAALAAQGYTCPEIMDAHQLPVKEEQVRRFIHRHNIPLLARRGAQPGEKHRDWKGGRTVDKHGYVLARQPDHPRANRAGYVREHRLVMEQHLGRYLKPEEVVHHINGDKADNRVENLEVFESNGAHLAATLKGCVPDWSEDGKRRLSEAVRSRRGKRPKSSD